MPIDEDWKKGASKELKGKDVEKTLIWKTSEVIYCSKLSAMTLLDVYMYGNMLNEKYLIY
jgi:hypothetical protein